MTISIQSYQIIFTLIYCIFCMVHCMFIAIYKLKFIPISPSVVHQSMFTIQLNSFPCFRVMTAAPFTKRFLNIPPCRNYCSTHLIIRRMNIAAIFKCYYPYIGYCVLHILLYITWSKVYRVHLSQLLQNKKQMSVLWFPVIWVILWWLLGQKRKKWVGYIKYIYNSEDINWYLSSV